MSKVHLEACAAESLVDSELMWSTMWVNSHGVHGCTDALHKWMATMLPLAVLHIEWDQTPNPVVHPSATYEATTHIVDSNVVTYYVLAMLTTTTRMECQ